MAETFVPLDLYLRPAPAESEPGAIAVASPELPPSSEAQPAPEYEAIAAVRRFRAAVADAVDVTVAGLLRDIAATVLARELELEPADVRAIVAREMHRATEGVTCVRVHPEEAHALGGCDFAVVPDEALRRGDALLEVRAGTIDSSLGVRLAAVLDAFAA
jgi:flagellar biosynthesis/type III secretory pathway protein FliH